MTDKLQSAYEDIFGVQAPPDAGAYQDSLRDKAVILERTAANLRLQAAINLRYAAALDETMARTGRDTSYMAAIHRACAARKKAQAVEIFPV